MQKRSLRILGIACLFGLAAMTLISAGLDLYRQRVQRDLVRNYLQQTRVRKLQIGAGTSRLEGWLNTDLEPRPGQVFLDAAQRFPLPDASFRYVFAEQLIEHLTYPQGQAMIAESYRVLEPGGTIRLATPNLLALVAMFDKPLAPEVSSYIRSQLEFEKEWPQAPTPECVILNFFVRSWGHQFVYDPKTLRSLLESAGFIDVVQFMMGQSEDPELRNIEQHDTVGSAAINHYVTMVLEARKPAR